MKSKMIGVIGNIFSRPAYFLLFLTASVFVFLIAVLAPNFSLLFQVWTDSAIGIGSKINLFFQLLKGIKTNFNFLSASYIILASFLFGMNIAMAVFYLKRRKNIKKSFLGVFSGGFLAGAMGVGCALCGSLFLTAFLSVVGLGGLLSFLPFEGGEFGVVGVILLFSSVMIISKQIANENICKI